MVISKVRKRHAPKKLKFLETEKMINHWHANTSFRDDRCDLHTSHGHARQMIDRLIFRPRKQNFLKVPREVKVMVIGDSLVKYESKSFKWKKNESENRKIGYQASFQAEKFANILIIDFRGLRRNSQNRIFRPKLDQFLRAVHYVVVSLRTFLQFLAI